MKNMEIIPCPICKGSAEKVNMFDNLYVIKHAKNCSLTSIAPAIKHYTVLHDEKSANEWNAFCNLVINPDRLEDIAVRFFRYAHARMHQMSIREIWKQFVEVDQGV